MTVLTDKPEVGQTNAALLVEELAGIYLVLFLRVGTEPKKVNCI